MRLDRTDLQAGIFFLVVGSFLALYAVYTLEVGSAFSMGPGYFPMLIGGGIALLGLAISARAFGGAPTEKNPVPWRGIVLLGASPVLFGMTVRGLGLVPAICIAVFVASFASRQMKVLYAVAITVAMVGFCYLVFKVAIGVPARSFGPWLWSF
jgi:Tripartite tricarboxylate transporter TctB family